MEVAIFLGSMAVLFVMYFAAKEFEAIAVMKGYKGKKYFWWSFLLGTIGYLMVVALPSKGAAAATPVSEDDIPEI